MSGIKLYKHFGIKDSTVNDREWLAESVLHKNNLLITIGDSWTWGDSLGKTNLNFNDKKHRYRNFYTSKLAEKLDADWLMIASCGQSNKWILNQYAVVKKLIDNGFYNEYNNIYVHVCFTELFRELDDVKKDIGNDLCMANSFEDFATIYFKKTVLDNLGEPSILPNLHTFGKNFWDLDDKDTKNKFLPHTWQELLFNQANIVSIGTSPVISGMGIWPLTNFLKENKLKDITYDFTTTLKKINSYIDQMDLCFLNNKKATKHPTEEGHLIWANFLYDHYNGLMIK